jgi:HAE1 family hydrophobic/amphiphilic exporter-1
VSLPEASVRRPVTVLVTAVTLAIFGALSFNNIPVELLPDLAYPTLTVQTVYADAAPTSVEQFVTRPLEESLGVIAGLREMRSVSRAGLSEVVLEFEWHEEMDFAAMNVREKLGLVQLPREAEPPRVLRFDPALDPIVRLSFSGDRPLDELRQVADRWLKPRLEAIQGVAAAKVRGGLDPEIQVEVDEDRVAALGLTLDDLAQALRAENVNRPGGTLKDWSSVFLVRTLHEFTDLDQLRRTVVREGPGGRVRVEDVATVRRGHRDRREIARSDGRETVEIALHREGSTNTLAVSRAIHEALDGPPGFPDQGLRAQLDDDLTLSVLADQSVYVADAIQEVWSSALVGGLLAIAVLYFFLRGARPTAIIGVSIPLSVVTAFLPMYKAGVSLNVMSLGGLALAVGMLVDNSVVVLEAIDRRRRQGLGPREAAARGAAEVAGAVTASTLTTVAVFLPIVFVQGVAGQLFGDLAITVCVSLVTSLAVSLTLIPMLSALDPGGVRRIALEQAYGAAPDSGSWPTLVDLAHPRHLRVSPTGGATTRLGRSALVLLLPARFLLRLLLYVLRPASFAVLWTLRALLGFAIGSIVFGWNGLARLLDLLLWPLTRIHEGAAGSYPRLLAAAVRSRGVVLPLSLALFVMSSAAVPLLGTQLVPDLSQGEFAFRVRLAEGSTLEAASDVLERIERRTLADGRFARVFSVVGSWPSTASGRQTQGENLAQVNFVLPAGTSADEERAAVERVREAFAQFPGVEAELAHPAVLSLRPPLAVHLFSEDLGDLEVAAETTARWLASLPSVEDVATSSEPGNPEVTIALDRARADALGVRAEPLARSLQRQIAGEVVGQFRESEQRLDIRLRASEAWRDRASQVADLRFRLDNGTILPVSAFAEVAIDRGPAAIHRIGGGRVAQVTGKVASADLGRTLGELREGLPGLDLPASVVAEPAGQDDDLRVSFRSLRLALLLAVFMVYVVMAAQFESLRDPFVILLTVPMGIIGVVLALWLTGTPISVLALIGAVMLAGIVVNNAIVLVDAINRRRREGEPLEAALAGAGAERLRPILMTTGTTVLALVPMALGLGAGDELRRPLAVTVVGGLGVSTFLTLFIIPCLYRAMARRERSPARAAEVAAAGQAEGAGA